MMQQALDQARQAFSQGEFPVGCVIAQEDKVLVTGSRLGTVARSDGLFDEINHAEMVTLQRYYRLQNRPEPEKLTLYCTMEPCLMCWGAILLSSIGTVVYAYEDAMGGATALNRDHLAPLYRQRKISVIAPVLRAESLALFKRFFQDPANRYWRDSHLARYTLSQ